MTAGELPATISTKELLMELRADVKRANESLAVLTSQGLDGRVRGMEEWQAQARGTLFSLKAAIIGLAGIATIGGFIIANLKGQ